MEGMIAQLAYALDTFYFLMSTALVMWMAAGFAMLESGLVRSKNTVEILNKNILLYGVATIVYGVIGYNIMYPGDPVSSWLPGASLFLGADHSVDAVVAGGEGAPYYSAMSDFIFQAVFAAATMSIVSGAVAERMKLWSFLVFAVFMVAFIYPVEGYWKWGGGFLAQLGFQDFAGSVVVHMAGAAAALAAVLLIGPRKGKYGPNGEVRALPGANLPLSALGMFILWMGWFGFNGGSELKIANVEEANAVARIFVNTNAAAAAGMVVAALLSRLRFGKTDITMSINGALGGLVAITAEPLLPSMGLSLLVGGIGGVVVFFSVLALDRARVDDPVGAISVHGTCGIWGIFAVLLTHPDATFLGQLIGTGATFAWMFAASAVVLLAIKAVMGLRVSDQEELEGMDVHECGMLGYPEFMPGAAASEPEGEDRDGAVSRPVGGAQPSLGAS
ncbi:ammonium transporter [Thiohalorhabdus methylotrophus]|uniref:Ammonium transporter n=1 Tax=Thiohalorhabdus methylotrophus TaxID=3242694 RepID=A0ABV4TSL8_9GAMM